MKRLYRKGIGRLTAQQLTAAVAAGDRFGRAREPLTRAASRTTEFAGFRPFILGEITGHTAIAGTTSRWEYSFDEVTINADLSLSLGVYTHANTAKALNLCEFVNDGALLEGPGWNIATAPSGFEIKPIAECVVQLWPHHTADGSFRWVFFASNVLDGECPQP